MNNVSLLTAKRLKKAGFDIPVADCYFYNVGTKEFDLLFYPATFEDHDEQSLQNYMDTDQFDFYINRWHNTMNYEYPFVNWNYDWRNGYQIHDCGDYRDAPWWENRLNMYPSFEQIDKMTGDEVAKYKEKVTKILEETPFDTPWSQGNDWAMESFVIDCYSAPTFDTVMRWFREKLGYHIDVFPLLVGESYTYSARIYSDKFETPIDCGFAGTYEEVCENAINVVLIKYAPKGNTINILDVALAEPNGNSSKHTKITSDIIKGAHRA